MRTTCLLLCAALTAGCMGSIESADSRKRVLELTKPELQVLCDWMEEAIAETSPSAQAICELEATATLDNYGACSAYVSECMSDRRSRRYTAGPTCAKQTAPPRTCTATVAEIKSCFLAKDADLVKAAEAASCGDVRGSRLPDSTLLACRNVMPQCKDLYGKRGNLDMAESPARPSTPGEPSDEEDPFDPFEDEDPFDPFEDETIDEDSGDEDPGEEPGSEEPGSEEPGSEEPGGEQPIDEQPPTDEQPIDEQPIDEQPPTDRQAPQDEPPTGDPAQPDAEPRSPGDQTTPAPSNEEPAP